MAWCVQLSMASQYCPTLEGEPAFRPPHLLWMQNGEPVDAGDVVKRLRVRSSHKKLHAFIPGAPPFVASAAFIQMVERFEPGVHQFFPIEVFDRNGLPTDMRYVALNIRHLLDALIKDRSEANWMVAPEDKRPSSLVSEGRFGLLLDRAIVAGRHLWREQSWAHGVFFSDELMAAVNNARLKGLACDLVPERFRRDVAQDGRLSGPEGCRPPRVILS